MIEISWLCIQETVRSALTCYHVTACSNFDSYQPLILLSQYFSFSLTEWLQQHKKMSPEFKEKPTDQLNNLLQEFFVSAWSKKGEPYSKSEMINMRSSLNRYLDLQINKKKTNKQKKVKINGINKTKQTKKNETLTHPKFFSRYLYLPPHNRTINLMWDSDFQ